ncbi:MAG: hypothetical protein QQN59_04860, partial [Nitrosopumilus sp.]
MNKSLRYIAFLAIVPLFTSGLTTDYFTDAEAYKSQGVPNPKFRSQSNVCGLELCSEIPGGKAAWMEQRGQTTFVAPVIEEEAMMEEVTEADLGSVLRLSRANVPTDIPLHQGYYDGGDV